MMENIQKALTKYWGYDGFLPLQKEAMECISRGTDSIVVLPTGGGKSLCFQAPAVTMPGLAVVVSPLISLMKDQVDALTECGVSAMRIDSSMSVSVKRDVPNQSEFFFQNEIERAAKSIESMSKLVRHRLSYSCRQDSTISCMWQVHVSPAMTKTTEFFGGTRVKQWRARPTTAVRIFLAALLILE